MQQKFRSMWAFCIVLALAIAFAGAKDEQDREIDYLVCADLTGARGGDLVASANTDPSTFNRLLTAGLSNAMIAGLISADLVHINRLTFELEASLAKSWEVEDDGRTYTIHLRRGLRFSDGTPFTADDVLFTMELLQDPEIPSVVAGQLQIDGRFPSVKKLDPHTLRLVFPRPVGMGLRAFDSVPILPSHRLRKPYQEGTLLSAWGPTAAPADVAGLGPFRLKEYQRGIKVVLERNPYYWKKDRSGQQLPYLDTLTFVIVQDRNAEALRFQAGEIDIIGQSFNAENYAVLRRRRQSGYTVKDLGPGLKMDFVWFNLNPGKGPSGGPYLDPEKLRIFQNSAFRRAVSQAMDREGMTRSIFLGLGTPQYGPISSGNRLWYYQDIPRPKPDPSAARQMLSRIGLEDRDGDGIVEYGTKRKPLEVTLLTDRGNAAREKMAAILKQNLAAAGIRMNVQFFLQNEIAVRFLNSFDYEAILFGITPTDVVPDLQTDLWFSSGKIHFWFPDQPEPATPWEAEIDELTSRLVQTLDAGKRKELFDRIQEIWAREMPAIPTIAPNILTGWEKTVGNVRPAILTPHLLWNAEELTRLRR